MKIIQVRNEEIVFGEHDHDAIVSSHESAQALFAGYQVVRVHGHEFEIRRTGKSRGEALSEIADYLKALSARLRTLAFEQEGVTGLTNGDLK